MYTSQGRQYSRIQSLVNSESQQLMYNNKNDTCCWNAEKESGDPNNRHGVSVIQLTQLTHGSTPRHSCCP